MKIKLYSLFIAVICLFSTSVYSQLAGWSFVKRITVANNATVAAINYQLKITINTQSLVTASQMNISGNDIRFGKNCSGTTLYNYWIEPSTMNTSTTNIWIKIDTIPAGGTRTFFMFHGNSTAAATSSVPLVFTGPHSSTDSVSTGGSGGATNSQRGFRFTPTEDLLVTHFGKREPNGTPREVTLFHFTTTAMITQFTVTGAAAQYNYGQLPNPLWIMGGTQYILSLYQGPTDGYYFGSSSQIGTHMTYGDMRYCNSCASNTFPTSILSNYHYGYPDLWYWTKNNITPAPTYTYNTPTTASSISVTANTVCSSGTVALNASNPTSGLTYSWVPNNASGASVVVSPSITTTYSLLTTQSSCNLPYNTVAVTITVSAAPSISVNSGAICAGNSFTLLPTGASTYTYSGGSAVVTPTASLTYTITGTNTLGCVGSALSSVTVNAIPGVTLSPSSGSVCVNGSTVALTGMPSGGVITGSNVAGGVFTPGAVSGTFTPIYSYTNSSTGCSNTTSTPIIVLSCTNLNKTNFGGFVLNIYPNPNSGSFVIELPNGTEKTITITDITGKVIHTTKTNSDKLNINISNLADGIYFTEVKSVGKVETHRIVKE